MPDIFGLKTISFWQAFGIIVLCAMVTRPTYEKKEQPVDVAKMLSRLQSESNRVHRFGFSGKD